MRKSSIIPDLINAAIFIILEIAALNMLSHNGQLQKLWISKMSHGIMANVSGKTQEIGHYFSLKKRNDALAQENFELRARLARLEAAAQDDICVATNGDFHIAGSYRYTPATISKISNRLQHNYMIIGKGSEDGIKEGSGVITGKGAVGVIDAVGKHYSYARSFKNHEMSISARLGKTGNVGPLNWDGRSSRGAVLREIPHHVPLEAGDTVYTSGYSSIFPPDIPLGTIGKARIINGATYEIEVTLFEDFGALRYVTIVENTAKEEMKRLEDRK